ncbi:MAG TPA: hypothetical protein DIC23_10035 [Planctomycetaceae bacterium]|nr:hypothetical protein [Planctomycetaceae bacterium]
MEEGVVVYSETERPWFAWGFVIVLLIVAACYAKWGWEIFENGWADNDGTMPFLLTIVPTFVVLVFCLRASWTYFVREDGFGVEFGYTGWSVRFDYSDIIEAKRVDIRWIRWGGFGWRLRPGGIGYIVRSGPGIQIVTKRSGRSYTFNCRDCEAMLAVLEKAGVAIPDCQD